jgi:biopolymer transport protein ExbD
MRFAPRPRRALPESIIPMINVVFLLLIFFLMSAQLAPPPPVGVTLPKAQGDVLQSAQTTLYLTEEGAVLGDLRGDAALRAVGAIGPDQSVVLRADAALAATTVAKTIAQLARLGITRIELAVQAP